MNYIQKAWLNVLRPVTYVLNDKLAKRSGWIGRFGRFFSTGPREFGYHPTNRLLAFLNHTLMETIGFWVHRYSVLKSLTTNGFHLSRIFRLAGLAYVPFVLMWFTILPYAMMNRIIDEVDGGDLEWLSKRAGYKGLPNNTMNHRTSAHFTEINNIYAVEMLKKTLSQDIVRERDSASQVERKTRYARPGYKYVAPSTQPDNK